MKSTNHSINGLRIFIICKKLFMQERKGKTMKKFLSKLLIDLIICSIFATSFVVSACAQSVNDNVFFTFSNENFSEFIPDEANKFAIQIYNEMTLYAKDYRTSFNLSTDDFYNIKL